MIPTPSSLDYAISASFNQMAQQSATLNRFLDFIAVTHPLKGGLLMLAVWWLWFNKRGDNEARHTSLLCTLVAVLSSVCLAKVITFVTPFRVRPLFNLQLALQSPVGVDASHLDKLSSFPSDHASLFIALAIGFFYVSRRMGWVSLVYSVIFICLPRVFLGFHFLSDVIVGGAIAAACVFIAQKPFVSNKVNRLGMGWLRLHPASFYCALFFCSYQIVNQFDEVRAAGRLFVALLKTTITTA
ncbi:MAG TPA: phosphatase PAP2 family protein [Pyrinomonadaceae bacterium]|nr:phosphatase PAP2 family protein [Pyrinomonadaceae bacterium]